ncbi:Methionyl-tRNA formyltransferase-like protein (plasmid) [Natrialba magadii ATCC 43099]|uniref:Methionyl-tRNA formyltransferase-like protein n=1 Tax=Natrialba magadii (strain ATCC 43099 / DSM 3394 / CCM 3739 / CIP 104546 / IAM 13178 / JCM 8861 / NBRC 102185 / NCIMB 2190 / MS3) TaxID=547559 RepID=D3T0Q7_NATMM|nr:formyltransferase family protein [Natrialba magadii]ADD07166.1 Methionyl-tRNA formyltransferase-like protein [Natrialba magadii ATCC 43099]ELY34573.1 methionyl-tRNA formyltransferase-like protein [Natrialba magadii ATCC 43099]
MAERTTIGILAEPFLYEWQVRAIDRVQTQTDAEISLVVTNAENQECTAESWNDSRFEAADVQRFVDVLRDEQVWALVLAERALARRLGDEQRLWHRHSVDSVEQLDAADHIQCDPNRDGNWYEFPDDVVSRLADQCDVLVLFGFGLLKGDVLTATDHGILSFHPADIRSYRGMGPPPIFHDGQSTAGATLQRLNESIDGGEIIAYDEVDLSDCHTLWDVFDRLVTLQLQLLPDGIERVCDPSFEPTTVPDDQLGAFYPRSMRRSPSFAGRVLAKNVAGRLHRQLSTRVGFPAVKRVIPARR